MPRTPTPLALLFSVGTALALHATSEARAAPQMPFNINYSAPGASGCPSGPCPGSVASTTCLDVHLPAGSFSGMPTLLLIHGGGWSEQSRNFYPAFRDQLTALGYPYVTIDYTLACDQAPSYPQAILDVRAAVAWVKTAGVAQFGLSDCIVVVGASSGGHLAAMIGALGSDSQHFAPPGYPGVDLGVALTITISGDFDLFRRGCQTTYCNCGLCPTLGNHVHLPAFKNEHDPGMTERFIGVKWGDTSSYRPYRCPTGAWDYRAMMPGQFTGDPFLDASPVHWLNASSSAFYMIHSNCDEYFPSEEPDWMIAAGAPYGIRMEKEIVGCGHAMRVFGPAGTADKVKEVIESGIAYLPCH